MSLSDYNSIWFKSMEKKTCFNLHKISSNIDKLESHLVRQKTLAWTGRTLWPVILKSRNNGSKALRQNFKISFQIQHYVFLRLTSQPKHFLEFYPAHILHNLTIYQNNQKLDKYYWQVDFENEKRHLGRIEEVTNWNLQEQTKASFK